MLVTTAAVCALLVWRVAGGVSFSQALAGASPGALAAALAVVCVLLVMSALRWMTILHAMGVRLGLPRALSVILSVWVFALLTPSRAADLLRAVAIRDLLPVSAGSSSVVAEKLVDVQSLCVLGGLGALSVGLWEVAAASGAALLGLWGAAWALLVGRERLAGLPLLRRRPGLVDRLARAFVALRASPRHYLGLSALSLASWCVNTGMLMILLGAFGAEVGWGWVFALWPASIVVGMLPLTVAGMGTRDATFLSLLGLTSSQAIDPAPVLAATLAYALVGTWFPAVLGAPFTFAAMRRWAQDEPRPRGGKDDQSE
jgi:hypothetical protein